MIYQVTANLAVDRIEPSIAFFEKVGFEVSVQVPEDDHIGFAILVHGSNQVMLQTRTCLIADDAAFAAAAATGPVMLFITVPSLADIVAKLEGQTIILKERETFYGAKEVTYSEPGGHFVTFAEFAEQETE
ncbi:MAG: hypothetical protein COB37_01975 [Kordiimonadales bacterium]|nr:MAG: hypothetical protein COB37_01975 [Kordiimonadales bacterium]